MLSRIEPPPLAAIIRVELSSNPFYNRARVLHRNRSGCHTVNAVRLSPCDGAFGDAVADRKYRSSSRRHSRCEHPLEKFGTAQPASYRYELQTIHRLESAANMHTAADLHVRPRFSNRADLKNRRRRERAKKYTTSCFPQRN